MKILFLVPYPVKESPSQRFRFEQYFNILTHNGYSYDYQTFLDSRHWQLFFKPGNIVLKTLVLSKGFIRRFFCLFRLRQYDFVFIHREASPVGPPLFEWLITHFFRKRLIYDFDDAIWLTDRKNESFLLRIIKWRNKVGQICRWSYKISCGNDYLCRYAKQFNHSVVHNPTTIDTETLHNPALYTKKGSNNMVIIGWTGSHSTLKYLKAIEEVIRIIQLEFLNVKFIVIADQKPNLNIPEFIFKKWGPDHEVEDLLTFDIGIMPLPDDEWSKGKCGFKALQYMALEIPTVASPLGVNTTIIEHGLNGFLAAKSEDWEASLKLLIHDKALRLKLGKAGREKVIRDYSVESNAANFLSLFA